MTNGQDGSNARGLWKWWLLRLVVFFFVLTILYGACQVLGFMLMRQTAGLAKIGAALGMGAFTALITIIAYRLLIRWTERRSADELAAAGASSRIAAGALAGVALISAVYIVLWFCGDAAFKGVGTADDLALAIGLSVASGVAEELIFRGAVFRLFEEGFGTAVAVLMSGLLFGLMHAGNPGATSASSLAIALEAGILLSAAYALTRSLWFPIGLHFGWNFAEGGIYGAHVSGLAIKGLISAPLSGPTYMTGGPFGPEASIPAVAVGTAFAAAMLVMVARRGEWRAIRFRFRTRAQTAGGTIALN